MGLRAARFLPPNMHVLALTSSIEKVTALRRQNITPLVGNLDQPNSLKRLAGLAHRVLHLAPPPKDDPHARTDPRTQALLRALRLRSAPDAVVYGSTSGVYGDCQGAWVTETRQVRPDTDRKSVV